MKLYELKLPIKVYEECDDGSTYLNVRHIDGLYAYCIPQKGGITYLSVSTPLIPYEDGYKISDQQKLFKDIF